MTIYKLRLRMATVLQKERKKNVLAVINKEKSVLFIKIREGLEELK